MYFWELLFDELKSATHSLLQIVLIFNEKRHVLFNEVDTACCKEATLKDKQLSFAKRHKNKLQQVLRTDESK